MRNYTATDRVSGKTVSFDWDGMTPPSSEDFEQVFVSAGLRGQDYASPAERAVLTDTEELMSRPMDVSANKGLIDTAIDVTAPAPEMVGAGIGKFSGQVLRWTGDAIAAGGNVIRSGLNMAPAEQNILQQSGKAMEDYYSGNIKNLENRFKLDNDQYVAEAIRGGLVSTGDMAATLPLAWAKTLRLVNGGMDIAQAAMKSAPVVINALSAKTGADSYSKYADRGHSFSAATSGAFTDAFIEKKTEDMETLPFFEYLTNPQKSGLKALAFAMGRLGLVGQFTEQLATLGQDMTDKVMGDPGMTAEQKYKTIVDHFKKKGKDGLTDLTRNARKTAISTLTMNAVMGGAGGAGKMLSERGTDPAADVSVEQDLDAQNAALLASMPLERRLAQLERERKPVTETDVTSARSVDEAIAIANAEVQDDEWNLTEQEALLKELGVIQETLQSPAENAAQISGLSPVQLTERLQGDLANLEENAELKKAYEEYASRAILEYEQGSQEPMRPSEFLRANRQKTEPTELAVAAPEPVTNTTPLVYSGNASDGLAVSGAANTLKQAANGTLSSPNTQAGYADPMKQRQTIDDQAAQDRAVLEAKVTEAKSDLAAAAKYKGKDLAGLKDQLQRKRSAGMALQQAEADLTAHDENTRQLATAFDSKAYSLEDATLLDDIKTEHSEGGRVFKTGTPVTTPFIHNTESATAIFGKPTKDSPFDRGHEPSGRYINVSNEIRTDLPGKMISGTVTFNNPLVVKGQDWKRNLSASFGGKTGKRLSQAIIAAGYDGVVTISNGHTSETLDLTTFDKSKAKYSFSSESAQARLTKTEGQADQDLVDKHFNSSDNLLSLGTGDGQRAVATRGSDKHSHLAGLMKKLFGVRVVFVSNAGGLNGMAVGDGVIFVDADGGWTVHKQSMWITGHELLHELKGRDEAEGTSHYNEFLKVFSTFVGQEAIDKHRTYLNQKTNAYNAKTGSKVPEYSEAAALEELVADAFGDLLMDGKFWAHLSKENPTVARQLYNILLQMLEYVQAKFTGQEMSKATEAYISDLSKIRDAAAQYLSAHIDEVNPPNSVVEQQKATEYNAVPGLEGKQYQPVKVSPYGKLIRVKNATLEEQITAKRQEISAIEKLLDCVKG